MSLTEGVAEEADVTISATAEAWSQLVNGDKKPEEMFLGGDLQIGGNFGLLANLLSVFSLAPPNSYLGKQWRLEVSYADGVRWQTSG